MEVSFDTMVRAEDTASARTSVRASVEPDVSKARWIRLEGSCPRCRHATSWRHHLKVVVGALDPTEDLLDELDDFLDAHTAHPSQGDETVDALCRCTVQHPESPAGAVGCGCAYRVRVVWP